MDLSGESVFPAGADVAAAEDAATDGIVWRVLRLDGVASGLAAFAQTGSRLSTARLLRRAGGAWDFTIDTDVLGAAEPTLRPRVAYCAFFGSETDARHLALALFRSHVRRVARKHRRNKNRRAGAKARAAEEAAG